MASWIKNHRDERNFSFKIKYISWMTCKPPRGANRPGIFLEGGKSKRNNNQVEKEEGNEKEFSSIDFMCGVVDTGDGRCSSIRRLN
jgi:hypothetical protein